MSDMVRLKLSPLVAGIAARRLASNREPPHRDFRAFRNRYDAFGVLRIGPAYPAATGVNPMRNRAWLAAVTILVLAGSPALADDKSACLAGIKSIKAAIAQHPAKPVLDQLQQALDSAQQEEIESDWDECVAAIRKVKLPKK
jgi:hypothetical protein